MGARRGSTVIGGRRCWGSLLGDHGLVLTHQRVVSRTKVMHEKHELLEECNEMSLGSWAHENTIFLLVITIWNSKTRCRVLQNQVSGAGFPDGH